MPSTGPKIEYLSARGACYYGSRDEPDLLVLRRIEELINKPKKKNNYAWTLDDMASIKGLLDVLIERAEK